MEKYFRFIKKVLLLYGFIPDESCQTHPAMKRALSAWKCFNLLLMTVGLFQIWLHTISRGKLNHMVIIGSVAGSIGIQGVLKLSVLFLSHKDMMELIMDIDRLYNKHFELASSESFLNFIGKVGIKIFTVNIVLAIFTITGSFSILLMSLITGDRPNGVFSVDLYFPFNEYDYLPWTLFYVTYIQYSQFFAQLVVDHLVVIAAAHLVISFDRLADEVKDVINGSDKRPFHETKLRLAKCVDFHNQLIEYCNKLNRVFGVSLFAFIAQASIILCFLGFLTIVRFFNVLKNCIDLIYYFTDRFFNSFCCHLNIS